MSNAVTGATGADPSRSAAAKFRSARPGTQRAALVQLFVGTAVLYAAFAIPYAARFATVDNATNMAEQACILLVVALAQMFALLIGGFDISVGANMGFVSVVSALLMTEQGAPVGVALAGGLAVGALIGFVNGVMIAALGINPFAATLGMLTFLIGWGNVLSNGATVGGLPSDFKYVGGAAWGPIPSTVGIAAVTLVLCWILLRRLRAGLYTYAIGGSANTARLAGVPVVRYQILAYTMCGLLAGLAGIMVASRLTVGQAELGGGYDLLSIATAVIGGTVIGGGVGTLTGVVIAAALIQVLNTGMDIAGIGEYVHRMVTGGVIVIAALLGQLRSVSFRRSLQNLLRRRGTANRLDSHGADAA
jgi:ribose/xylose/arabinose/galactoside ABC-type transport system permease subunit